MTALSITCQPCHHYQGMYLTTYAPHRIVAAPDWSDHDRGYPHGGPQDRFSVACCNRLVGNADDAPTLEWDLGVCEFTVADDSPPVCVVVGGSPMAVSVYDSTSAASAASAVITDITDKAASVSGSTSAVQEVSVGCERYAPVVLQPRQRLTAGPCVGGVHGYLAVAGGGVRWSGDGQGTRDSGQTPELVPMSDVSPGSGSVPGSVAGAVVSRSGRRQGGWASAGAWAPRPGTLRCVPGPEWHPDLEPLLAGPWRVAGPRSRMGMRLQGPSLPQSVSSEINSGPVVDGCVQLTGAEALLLLRDRQSLGGYARGWVVIPPDVDIAAQIPSGSAVRFVMIDPDDVTAIEDKRQQCLDALFS